MGPRRRQRIDAPHILRHASPSSPYDCPMRGERGPGDRVGRYRIVRTIGRGGMGITYEAQPVTGGPSVALKELGLSRLDDWKPVELFKREADVLASIRLPAVPYYVDHFTVETGEGPV